MRPFLAVLRSFFHSSLLCTFSCHTSTPTILPSSFASSCHLFLGLAVYLVVPNLIYNTFWGVLFPSILCTCPNQRNLFNLIVNNEPMDSKTGGRLRNFVKDLNSPHGHCAIKETDNRSCKGRVSKLVASIHPAGRL